MTNADTKENLPDDSQESKGKDTYAETLANVTAQLAQLAAEQKATQQAIIAATRKQEPEEEVSQDNEYNPAVILKRADQAMDRRLKAERAKDTMIYNMAEEYPEIRTNQKIKDAVVEAHKLVPESIRDSADGYKMAVLEAVQKNGLVPKSRRQTVDEDVSMSPRGGGERRQKSEKISNATLATAELMGLDVNDKAVVERLEKYSNRRFSKYE